MCCNDIICKQITHYPLCVYDSNFGMHEPVIMDDEGTRKYQSRIIFNGVAESLLTDSNNRCGKSELSGNCRRESIYKYPEPRMHLLKIKQGFRNIDEIKKSINHELVVQDVFNAKLDHRSGIVRLYAYINCEIIDGVSISKRIYAIIQDKIENFFYGLHALSDTTNLVQLYCNSSSGYLYTESESPDALFNNIYIERMWSI